MQADDESQWRDAEALVHKKFDGLFRRAQVRRMSPRLHYGFIASKGDENHRVVVYGGAVREGGGLGALGGYLRDVALLQHPDLDADAMLDAVLAFAALPDGHPNEDYYYRQTDWLAEMNPALTFADGAGAFALTYRIGTQSSASHPRGSVAGPPRFYFERCTLAIPADYRLAWKCERFDKQKPAGG